jgi:hypothetical protein
MAAPLITALTRPVESTPKSPSRPRRQPVDVPAAPGTGHTVILLLGDFTTQTGDPTGRSRTRPVLPLEAIQRNTDALLRQALPWADLGRLRPSLRGIDCFSSWA